MKTIVCYGDSNTYGYIPSGGRYPRSVRWTGVLQQLLGADYYVVEEGLCSRTTVLEDAVYDDNKSGAAFLPTVIKSQMPVDLLVLMLGTNDMKLRFSMQPCDIARGISLLIKLARTVSADKSDTGTPCSILLLAPPPVSEDMLSGRCADEFGERAIGISQRLSAYLKDIAEQLGVSFLDTYPLITPSPVDGLHLSADGHRLLAQAVAQSVQEIFGDSAT